MRWITLVTSEDDYDTKPGFILEGSAKYDGFMSDRDGMLTAHDILEHVNGAHNIGPVWDELEALGAAWWVRLEHGTTLRDRPSYHSMEQNVVSDLLSMWQQWDEAGGSGAPCPSEAMSFKANQSDVWSTFTFICELAKPQIIAEYGRDIHPTTDEEFAQEVDRYLAEAVIRMRIGYDKARRRYKRETFRAMNMFLNIRDAVKAAVREIDYEGQRFRLGYSQERAVCFPIREEY